MSIYTFQILSLVLSKSDMTFHHQALPRPQVRHTSAHLAEESNAANRFDFFTSQAICITICSSPLVAFIFLSLLHSLMLTFEQVIID